MKKKLNKNESFDYINERNQVLRGLLSTFEDNMISILFRTFKLKFSFQSN